MFKCIKYFFKKKKSFKKIESFSKNHEYPKNCDKIFFPKIKKGKVQKVIDGDTIKIISFYQNDYYLFKCRLHGIDTPEIRTKDKLEKRCGIIAKQYLRDLIEEEEVLIETIGIDCFGRLVVRIYIVENDKEKFDVSDILLKKEMAIPFGMKKKMKNNELKSFYSWILQNYDY